MSFKTHFKTCINERTKLIPCSLSGCWAFLLITSRSHDDVNLVVACMAFVQVQLTTLCVSVTLSATVALVCLFGPKLHIIAFQTHKNVRKLTMTPSERAGTGTQGSVRKKSQSSNASFSEAAGAAPPYTGTASAGNTASRPAGGTMSASRARRLDFIKSQKRHSGDLTQAGCLLIRFWFYYLYPVYTRKHTWSTDEAHLEQPESKLETNLEHTSCTLRAGLITVYIEYVCFMCASCMLSRVNGALVSKAFKPEHCTDGLSCVNELPSVITWQWNGRESNPRHRVHWVRH